jgi:hypothetical protein
MWRQLCCRLNYCHNFFLLLVFLSGRHKFLMGIFIYGMWGAVTLAATILLYTIIWTQKVVNVACVSCLSPLLKADTGID